MVLGFLKKRRKVSSLFSWNFHWSFMGIFASMFLPVRKEAQRTMVLGSWKFVMSVWPYSFCIRLLQLNVSTRFWSRASRARMINVDPVLHVA